MNRFCVKGLRCPVCGEALQLFDAPATGLRCAQGHCFDIAKQGYVHLLPLAKKHAADPGDNKEMVHARRRFLETGAYTPFFNELARLCLLYAPKKAEEPIRLVDAGCGEGSYDRAVLEHLQAEGRSAGLIGFDLSREAVRLAAKLLPQALFCVGGCFAAPVQSGWADLVLDIFSPFAQAEFWRMLRPGGILLYAVPTARHLYGLKQILYDTPYENTVRNTEYEGFRFLQATEITANIELPGTAVPDLFAMTPYYWKTPPAGAARLAECKQLKTEIGFRFLVYQKQ